MTKSVMPDGKLHKSQWLSPTILIRVGSILLVGLMIGHMSAYPWTSMKALQETQLTMLMNLSHLNSWANAQLIGISTLDGAF